MLTAIASPSGPLTFSPLLVSSGLNLVAAPSEAYMKGLCLSTNRLMTHKMQPSSYCSPQKSTKNLVNLCTQFPQMDVRCVEDRDGVLGPP
jgi:hypothetical protein